jgi:hypothetical protein
MKKIDPNNAKQMGNMGLHILGINDMPPEKWLSWFEDEHTKKVALADEQGYIARLPVNLQEKARDLLTNGVGDQLVATANNCNIEVVTELVAVPPKTYTTKAHVTHSVKSSVVTDKGVYHSVENLKERLSGVYSIDGFDKVFINAVELSGLPVDVEYISDAAKKKLLSNVKVAMVSAIESIVDNV